MILRQLEYLVALARERHFGRAASACGVTQPTLSSALRELEAELDVLIVERSQRYGGLTVEGQRVVEWAQRILSDAEALKQDIGALRGGLAGRLVLGVIPTALASTGLLTAPFRASHPKVSVTLLSLSSIEIQRGLDSFEIDAGITYLDNEPLQHVRTLPLYGERYFLATSDRALFAGRESVTWAEAAQAPLCLLTPDMQNRRIIEGAFREAGVAPQPVMETNSVLALFAYLRSAAAAAVLTEAPLRLFGQATWLRTLSLVEPDMRRAIGLVYPDREPQQPITRALVEVAGQKPLESAFAGASPMAAS